MSPSEVHCLWLYLKDGVLTLDQFSPRLQYNTTLLPSVNTLIARAMFCGAKYTHHTFTPTIKHLITTIANKYPRKSHS